MNRKWQVAIVAVLVMTLGVAYWLYSCVSVSLEAERTHQVNHGVLLLVTTYLQEHSENWPSSWDDLKNVDPEPDAWYDFEEMQKRVQIDFSLTTEQVAEMTVDDFDAIKPIGPNYGPLTSYIRKLLEVANEIVQKEEKPARSPKSLR